MKKLVLALSLSFSVMTASASDLGSVTIRFIDTFTVYPVKNPTPETTNACIIETTDGISAHPGPCSKHIKLFLRLWETGNPGIPYTVEENGNRHGG
ncbi:TPA: hypothetical protein ACKQAN_003204 [Serratia marcescens]|uniref:hypothetical protein n=1 Tax=Serratia TaxID=613 RepID=UPI00135CF6FD|nr:MULTISPECIES: hypothetical protein [Serratia]QPJ88637.1 hypothetical protein HS042_10080 [Serratia marcescens]HAT3735756.1 hypothetical protein [Serratia marcescens]